jgi:2'-5' RNA ligase
MIKVQSRDILEPQVATAKANGNGANGHSSKLAPMDLARYRARVQDSYALVSYLPEPLSSFLDDLSRQLVPGCRPRAHITLLPPRHLSGTVEEAKECLDEIICDLEPFDLEITTIKTFDVTCVIYADIGHGRERLLEIYRQLNQQSLYYKEQFSYHPHVTLAINPSAGECSGVTGAGSQRLGRVSGQPHVPRRDSALRTQRGPRYLGGYRHLSARRAGSGRTALKIHLHRVGLALPLKFSPQIRSLALAVGALLPRHSPRHSGSQIVLPSSHEQSTASRHTA